MINKGQYFSPEGLEKLKKELEERKYVLRKEIAAKILEAKDLGDLAENAEFTEAKEMQAFNEGRIEELESIIKNAMLISIKGGQLNSVFIAYAPFDNPEIAVSVVIENIGKKQGLAVLAAKSFLEIYFSNF